jgi:pimeloyl-ACP methyl ester carboxylesterase
MSFLYRAGPTLAELLNEQYDIVSWDPRGINNTTPRVSCFESQTAQDLFLSQELAIESKNLSNPSEIEILRNQVRKLDAQRQVVGALCQERSGKSLRHVGTATVVRDLELLSRKIEGEETPINFWGFSYGTVVGSYLVNMFPTRLGKVAIDGVVDPVLWATTPSHTWPKYDFVDTDKAFDGFVRSCVAAGEERCPLAKHGKSPGQLASRITDFIDDLYDHPVPIVNSKTPGVLTSGGVRSILFVNMYRPRGWPRFANLLSDALSGNATALYEAVTDTVELDTSIKPQTAFAIDAVTCVDGPDLAKVKNKAVDEVVQEIVKAWDQTSKIFGNVESGSCHHWPVTETERFVGPFNHTNLSNDILIIGNTADPITPLVNAKTVNSLLPQSRLIIQDGYGHCSLAMSSLCTGKAVRGYFLDGTLPKNGLFCETNEVLFPKDDKAQVWDVKNNIHMESEDWKMMETLKNLGSAMEPDLMSFKRPRSLF